MCLPLKIMFLYFSDTGRSNGGPPSRGFGGPGRIWDLFVIYCLVDLEKWPLTFLLGSLCFKKKKKKITHAIFTYVHLHMYSW